jgi:hypothetical protein
MQVVDAVITAATIAASHPARVGVPATRIVDLSASLLLSVLG